MSDEDTKPENLAALIEKASQKFDSELTAAREDLRKGIDSLSADQKEKWEKHEAAVGEAAKTLSDLTAAAEAEAKKREDLEVKVEELSRRGVNVDGAKDPEMLDARIALTQARQEFSEGGAKRIYGDEPESELASAEDVKLLDAAFTRYVTKGLKDFNTLEGGMPEHTFAVGSGLFSPSYGILVPPFMTNRIMRELYTYGSLRGMALMRTGVPGDSVKLMLASGKTTVTVGNELTDWSPGNLPKLSNVEYPILDWAVTVAIHRNVMEDASMNVQTFLRQEATAALGETEAGYHATGDGVGKPLGITATPKTDVAASGDVASEADFGTIKAVKTGVDGGVGHATTSNASYGFNPAIAAVNGLHSRYRMNATWMMSRGAYAAFAMVRDADGRYLMPLSEQLAREGGGISLVSRPVFINDHMPALANDAYFAAIGDWRQGYEIADKSASMYALVDVYSNKPNIEITLSRRSGARVADTRAIRLLKADQ